VREAVAQDEPRPREVAYGVPVFRRDPRRDERDVGQCFGGFFRNGVEEHEGDHVHRRRSERGGRGAYGRGVPDPPDRQGVPQHERERRPAEHAPPRAARVVVRRAHPQQRDEPDQERHARHAEPPRREQDGR